MSANVDDYILGLNFTLDKLMDKNMTRHRPTFDNELKIENLDLQKYDCQKSRHRPTFDNDLGDFCENTDIRMQSRIWGQMSGYVGSFPPVFVGFVDDIFCTR